MSDLEEIDDEWLAAKARKVLKDIQDGGDRLISWEECKRRLDQYEDDL